MATGKKFYWIKLKKDFMTGDVIDFLMSQNNGAEYVVLYQMLCMQCINTNGVLATNIGEMLIPYDVKKIQRDCKYFSIDTVICAMEIFKKLGLIYEQGDGVLAITNFSELVGYETDWARQKAKQRGKNKAKTEQIEQGNDNLIGVDNVHSNVTKGVDNVHTEKEIEKEIEKDINNIYTPHSEEQNPKPKKPPKHKYGEYAHVLLSDDEYKKLCTQYGEEMTLKSIKYLDEYIEMKGYKAKSHYLCMKKWVFGAVLDDENKVNKVNHGKNQFNSFPQRNRSPEDMEQLEKILLTTSVPEGEYHG